MKKRTTIQTLGAFLAGAILFGSGVAAYAVTSGGAWDNDVQNQAVAQENHDLARLVTNQPAPNLSYSVERQNLITRYKTFSDKNKISYIALTTLNGGIIYTGTVKGKVSALSSQLTPQDRMSCVDAGDNGAAQCTTISLAEPDGTWATNGSGIFWFDDSGVYHEYNGTYLTADAPFTLTTPPVLNIDASAQTK